MLPFEICFGTPEPTVVTVVEPSLRGPERPMAHHHVLELAVAGAAGLVKLVGELLGEMVTEGIFELLKAPFRRKERRRALTGLELDAEKRRGEFWAEALAEARAHAPDRPEPDPHVLKLRKGPTPPSAARPRRRADRGDEAFQPLRRSTGG